MSAELSRQVRGLFSRRRDETAQGSSEVEMRLQAAEGRADAAETRVSDLQTELMFYGDAIRSLKGELEAVTERVISRVAPQVVELEARNAQTDALRESVNALQEDAESERARLLSWRAEMESLVASLGTDIETARSHIDRMPERIRDALTPAAEAMTRVGSQMAELTALSMPSPIIPPAEPHAKPTVEPAMEAEDEAPTQAPWEASPDEDNGSSFDHNFAAATSFEAFNWKE